jgi:cytochrome b561
MQPSMLLVVPKLAVSKGDAIVDASEEGHEIMDILMALLALFHVGAALWHPFGARQSARADEVTAVTPPSRTPFRV